MCTDKEATQWVKTHGELTTASTREHYAEGRDGKDAGDGGGGCGSGYVVVDVSIRNRIE